MKHPSRSERGVALVVSLIMLVIITLLGVSSARNVVLEERMSSNMYDRGLGFQSVEAAIRLGESIALAQSEAIPPNSGFPGNGIYNDSDSSCGSSLCSNGLCAMPDKDCQVRWSDSAFGGWQNASGLSLSAVDVNPQFIVEYLGGNFPCNIDNPDAGSMNCRRYRVTARSVADGRAMVMLQSVFATE